MKKSALFAVACSLAIVCSLAVVSSAPAGETLTLDAQNSKISFVGSKPDGKHKGGFKKFAVKAEADWEVPENSKLNIAIDTGSLWSDNEKLTAHLKSPDFFNIRRFPKATFASTSIQPEEEGKATIAGKFTLLGKAKELKIPVNVESGEDNVVLKADFEVDRNDYGMVYGPGKINDKVKVSVQLALKRSS